MSDVLIPLGGAGGKNRGTVAVIGDNAPFSNTGAVMSLPLPAGNYKKSVSNPRAGYGDGKNSEVTISKGLLKQMAIDAFGIASITNFSATMYAHKQVRLTWAKPTRGLWSGVFFVFKKGRMPNSVYDSDTQYASGDTHLVTQPLSEGVWYIRAFNYVATNNGRWYDDGKVSYMINVTGISGSITFGAGAGTWTVPEGVRRIRYILVGQGGQGGWGTGFYAPGGGGGGGYFTTGYMDVTPGQGIPWIIPSASADFNTLGGVYKQGLDTVFGSIRSQHGRSPLRNGFRNYNNHLYSNGGDGGSGGAAYSGSPGSNGNDGSGSYPSISEGRRGDKTTYYFDSIRPGYGQHTSTTGFNGVLYSTGGMAGIRSNDSEGTSGTDGLGNGGNGANARGYGGSRGGGRGGTGCIYIAWGSSMNDGS
nr:MAG TPA: hypothetical protein [Caudoviricetes sp.]DAQ14405.1 MAG TPA: hypothetical protein [Caudoviricetes sp.]